MRRIALALITLVLLTGCAKQAPVSPPPTDTPTTAAAPAAIDRAEDYKPGEKHQQALDLIGREDYRAAIPVLQELVAAEPDNAVAWNDLSFAQAHLMKYSEAIVAAQKALKLRPNFIYAKYNLGWALLQTADWKAAKTYLEASEAAQPDRPEPLNALGEWYERAAELNKAAEYYRKAANLGDKGAASRLAYVVNKDAREKRTREMIQRFPNLPEKLVRHFADGYSPEGYLRRITDIKQVRFARKGNPTWAALIFEENGTTQNAFLELADTDPTYGYMGRCQIRSVKQAAAPPDNTISLQVFSWGEAEHVLINHPGGSLVCDARDYGSALFTAKTPATVSGSDISSAGVLYRFVPPISKYLPVTEAQPWLALIDEIRAAGNKMATFEAIHAMADAGGGLGMGQALAWAEPTQQYRSDLIIAFKPAGQPVIITRIKADFPDPYSVGTVKAGGHTFLAVATHQPGAPNGGDVVVLEYEPAKKTFRAVFHGGGDGAGFGPEGVSTSYKRYKIEGGYDRFVTSYKWDETKYTFVKASTTNAGHE